MTSRARIAFAIAVTASIAFGIAAWTRLPHGGLPSLSFDGFRYLAGAYSLRDHGTYRDIDGQPQHSWPPGTSMLYAAGSRASGRPPEELPGIVGIVAYVIAMLAVAIALGATVRRAPIASVAFIAVACNSFVVSMTNKLWSDPLALACLAVALALLIAGRPTIRTIIAAGTVSAVAIMFRYAMIAAVSLPLWAAWRIRLRRVVWVVAGLFAVLVIALVNHISQLQALPLRDDLHGFATLANQLVPVQAGVVGIVALVIVLGLSVKYRHDAAAITIVWFAAYVSFLFLAQAIAKPTAVFDLRMLIPLYPAMVIAIASAADSLFDRKSAAVATVLVAILVIADVRAFHGLLSPPQGPAPCVDREQIVSALEARHIDDPQISSNAQGLVWYALRRPVRTGPRTGDTYVLIDPSRVCDGVTEGPPSRAAAARVIALP